MRSKQNYRSFTVCWTPLSFFIALFMTPACAEDNLISHAYAAGKARFESECAICHGIDGKGGGGFGDLLNVDPGDLTILKKRNNGSLPFSDIYNAIDGRNAPLRHALQGMPSWGKRYNEDDGNETLVRGKILELILYVDSLQVY